MIPILLISVLGCLLAAPAVLHRFAKWCRAQRDPGTGIVLKSLFISMMLSVSIGLVIAVTHKGLQAFAQFGLVKTFTLPMVYGIYLSVLLLAQRPADLPRRPFWWTSFAVILTVSLLAELILPRADVLLIPLAQGVVLICGTLASAALGMRARYWSMQDVYALLIALAAISVLGLYLNLPTTPFNLVFVPVGFALIHTAIRVGHHRVWTLALAVIVLYPVWNLVQDPSASLALITQLAVCAACVLLASVPRAFRKVLFLLSLVGGIWLVHRTGIGLLMLGRTQAGWDVTLTHRAYETRMVFELIGSSPSTLLFGGGPGATVDLSGSPDVMTLISAGRNVYAVDDVHLLTSWILLKFGLLGIIWLIMLMIWFLGTAYRILSAQEPPIIDVALLLLASAGLIAALSAATYLFTNPLTGLSLGALSTRARMQANPSGTV